MNEIERPVFVVGCCNSGTTILWRALMDQKEFDGPKFEGQDLKELPQCMRQYLGRKTFRMWAHPKFKSAHHLREKDYEPALSERLRSVYREHCKDGTRLLEKSPPNSLRTRFLQRSFPDAYFVIIVRNGFAVSEGIVRKRSYDPDRPHMAGLPTTIEQAAEQWSNANRTLLRDKRLLRRSITIRYEDLVCDTANVLQSILRFCECLTPNLEVPRFQEDLNEKQTARLSPEEKKAIRRVAGDMLHYFGYL